MLDELIVSCPARELLFVPVAAIQGLFVAARLLVVRCLFGAGGHMSGIPQHYARFEQSGSLHSQKRCITTCQAGTDARAARNSLPIPL